MKPSEHSTKIQELTTQAEPLRAELAPLDEQIEEAKKAKAEIIGRVSAKLRRARKEMPINGYQAFREAVMAADEDDRESLVDAKLKELKIDDGI